MGAGKLAPSIIFMDNVTITDKAKDRLISLLTDDKPNVELSVMGGGCSGLSYSFKYTDKEIIGSDKVYDYEQFKYNKAKSLHKIG